METTTTTSPHSAGEPAITASVFTVSCRRSALIPAFSVADHRRVVSGDVDAAAGDMLTLLQCLIVLVDMLHVLIDAVERCLGADLISSPNVNPSDKRGQCTTTVHTM